jgi:putative membrane protein
MNRGLKIGIIIGSVVIAILFIGEIMSAVFGGWRYSGWGMMGPSMMGGIGFWWLMPVLVVVFWGLVIWGLVTLVRSLGSSTGHTGSMHSSSAVEILKERYARGEISKEEFEDKKKDLL